MRVKVNRAGKVSSFINDFGGGVVGKNQSIQCDRGYVAYHWFHAK